jgi:hypothetical protein
MTWPEAVAVCNRMTALTGDHWAVKPGQDSWLIVCHGPYDPPAPAGTPAAAFYFKETS